MVNGEEPPAVDAVPLRRSAPDDADRAAGARLDADRAAGASIDADRAAGAPDEAGPAGGPGAEEPSAPTPAEGPAAAAEEPSAPAAEEAPPAEAATAATGGAGATGGAAAAAAPAVAGVPALVETRAARRLFGRGAYALRRVPPPHRVAATAARHTAEWSRRPHGRFALAGLFIAALLGLTGLAGAYLVPSTVPVDATRPAGQESPADPAASDVAATATAVPTTVPSAGPGLTASALPSAGMSSGAPIGVAGARPADVLGGWAQQLATRVDVPVVALQAYGYAELVLAETTPECQLSWTTLAAIGKVESNHGTGNNATLYPDGRALPAIIGPPLDGTGGRKPIADTDGGALDNDTKWDRAVGPMQFIPSTWRTQAVDADNDAVRDPNDIDDAALAAANYLCANGRNLATPEGWWDAVAAYNRPRSYGQAVFAMANTYGTRSRG